MGNATAATVGDGGDEMKAFWCDVCDSTGQPKAIYDCKRDLLVFHNIPIFFRNKLNATYKRKKNVVKLCIL